MEQVTSRHEEGGSLQAFVPAVAATEEGGECEILNIPGHDPVHVLSFPRRGASVRTVSIVFDSTGQPLHYSDSRGDLRRERTGPRTSVLLTFEEGVARGINDVPGQPSVMAEGTLMDAMEAPHLGNPRRMMELIRTRCAKP